MALPKVGVLTFHRSINYGSFWQAARLVAGLRSRGHGAELLDHECRAICSAELRCALQPELPKRTSGRLLNRYATKARRLAKAIGGLPLSTRFPLQQPELAGDYDTIVVGSDEVWNFRHPSLQTDLLNAGAEWVDQPSVTDGNLTTSRNPDDIPQFNEAMIGLFARQRKPESA